MNGLHWEIRSVLMTLTIGYINSGLVSFVQEHYRTLLSYSAVWFNRATNKVVYRRPSKIISLKEKLAILRQFESGTSRRDVANIFKCSQSTISRILVNKESIIEEAKNCNGDIRENLTAINYAYKELYKALTKWAREMKQTDAEITVHMARNKAEEVSLNMGRQLTPSKAWLYKWREREGVVFSRKKQEQHLQDFLEKQDKQPPHLKNLNKESITEKAKDFTIKNLNDSMKHCHNPRIKRRYTKRLPIIDASGMICRSRKEKNYLTLLQKLEILQRLKNGERKSDLGLEYNLSQSALTQVVNDEEKILEFAAKGQNLQMKIVRSGIFREGEIELNKWVLLKMAKGVNVTRTQVINRAKKIAERLKINFKASTGWLEKWKARMNMDFNENQILHRKIPTYLGNEDNSHSGLHEDEHQSDMVYDQFESEDIKPKVDVCHVNAISPEVNAMETELLTPQQFYLKTIQNDRLAGQSLGECEKEPRELEERDIKPLINVSPPLDCTLQTQSVLAKSCETSKYQPLQQNKKLAEQGEEHLDIKPLISLDPVEEHLPNTKESFKDQVHSWLQRYNIENSAAEELLDILKAHLDNKSANERNHTIEQRN
ncbi:hypothetical protein DOY81_001866 [Sarcophaga bullata]|nr:hypothetical protein DOY81_001866 [Sarcophaga bullata]